MKRHRKAIEQYFFMYLIVSGSHGMVLAGQSIAGFLCVFFLFDPLRTGERPRSGTEHMLAMKARK